jgi:hypothetical protein
VSSQEKGWMILVDPDAKGPPQEWATITCNHCNVVRRITKEDLGGFCRMCMKDVCGPCADHGGCKPFEKRLDEYEKAAARGRYLDHLLKTG